MAIRQQRNVRKESERVSRFEQLFTGGQKEKEIEQTDYEEKAIESEQPPQQTQKKKRGRKPKSEQKASFSETFINVPKTKPQSKKQFMSMEQAVQVTDTILYVTENMAVNLVGSDGKMNEAEKMMFHTSLPTMLTKMEQSTIEKTSGILFPLILVGGIGMYGARIFGTFMQQKEEYLKEQSLGGLGTEEKMTEDNNEDFINPLENERNQDNIWERQRTINFQKLSKL